MDACEKLLETDVDIVLLAPPPGFRPLHYRACIDAGKHCFVEKPVAVDAPGVRSVMETNRKAEGKGLFVVSGLCWRYETQMQDIVKRLQDGAIGDIVSVESLRYGPGVGKMVEREDGWSDMVYQVRNWYSGKTITWDEMMKSDLDYSPPSYDWDQKLPEPPVSIPGKWDYTGGSAWDRDRV